MPRGSSGKIVIEVPPALKNDLYGILGQQNKTLKDWFLEQAAAYIENQRQPSLSLFQGLPISAPPTLKK